MKILYKYLLIIFLPFLFLSCINSVEWEKETIEYKNPQAFFDIQLLPGMKASGWKFHYSESGNFSFHFEESPDIGWLEIADPSVYSHLCETPKAVQFDFIAPLEKGEYIAKVVESNSKWPETKFSMVVTDAPTANVINKTLSLNPGGSFSHTEYLSWQGVSSTGWPWCVPNPYYPSNTQDVIIGTNAPSDIIKLEPRKLTINKEEYIPVNFNFYYKAPGTYVYYIYIVSQWKRNPTYFKWTITMN